MTMPRIRLKYKVGLHRLATTVMVSQDLKLLLCSAGAALVVRSLLRKVGAGICGCLYRLSELYVHRALG